MEGILFRPPIEGILDELGRLFRPLIRDGGFIMLDKLWVRLKGELLLLKEEIFSDDDVRDKAETLVDKLERRFGSEDPDPAGRRDLSERVEKLRRRLGRGSDEASKGRREDADLPSDRELEDALEELKRRREQKRAKGGSSSQALPPNPRQLG